MEAELAGRGVVGALLFAWVLAGADRGSLLGLWSSSGGSSLIIAAFSCVSIALRSACGLGRRLWSGRWARWRLALGFPGAAPGVRAERRLGGGEEAELAASWLGAVRFLVGDDVDAASEDEDEDDNAGR